jgi:hypothetical protein
MGKIHFHLNLRGTSSKLSFRNFSMANGELLPIGFLEIEVAIEAGGDHKKSHFQFKALRGNRMNRLR